MKTISSHPYRIILIFLAAALFLTISASTQSPSSASPVGILAPGYHSPLAPAAPTNLQFSYQGQLLDANGDPISGNIDMVFSLYDQQDVGTGILLWTEAYTGTQAITVTNGLFHVLLGSLTPIAPADLTDDIYLELAIGNPLETLSPRELLTSVAGAGTLVAGATTKGGLTVSGILHMAGAGTGSTEGGEVRFYLADDYDSAYDFYRFDVYADYLRIGRQGTTDIVLASNGNVGIGTTSPAAEIHIKQGGGAGYTSAYAGAGVFIESAGASALQLGTAATDWAAILFGDQLSPYAGKILYHNSSDYMALFTDDSEKARILSNGNVGIGTTAPGAKLDVNGDTHIDGSLVVNYDDNDARSQHIFIRDASDPNQKLYIGIDGDDEYASIQYLKEGSHWGALALQASGGNVGIGTTSPNNTLDVVGTLDVSGTAFLNGITLDNDADITGANQIVGYNDLMLAGSPGPPDVYIDSGGNVGIGTTVPGAYKLNVEGNTRVAGDLTVDGICTASLDNATSGDSLVALPAGESCSPGNITAGNITAESISSAAFIEIGLLTPEQRLAGRIEEFSQGDLLCWDAEKQALKLCDTADDRLVMAVANVNGLPIVSGAEPVKVISPVQAGDILVASDVPGYAMVNNNPLPGTVIGQALEDFEPDLSVEDGDRGVIKAMIRKW